MTSPADVRELRPVPEVCAALGHLSHLPGVVLFESVVHHGERGRYSFLTADPFERHVLRAARYGVDPLAALSARMEELACPTLPELPPFQGGAAGLLSYELGQCFERLPQARWNDNLLPAVWLGLYDWVLAWDHRSDRCWIICQGFPETTLAARRDRARARADWVERLLAGERLAPLDGASPSATTSVPGGELDECLPLHKSKTTTDSAGAPEFPLKMIPGLVSNFDRAGYLNAVRQVIEKIFAGDIFQANLSQRLMYPTRRSPLENYLSLREHNPAPFGGFLAEDDWAVLSSSPERFLQVTGNVVSTRPIKGTRQRRTGPEADLFTRDELRESEKDRAENVMIVDLLRNDLSRVCRPGSIRVPELCQVEAYETVTHLVSEVRGELRDGTTFWDALRASFPGGSITGAPKIRAMEIISELEQVPRGAYCGSLCYCGFDGTADSSILIRTMSQRRKWLQLPAGGGVVALSDPADEYEETLHKARGMLASLR